MTRICSMEGCEGQHVSRGLCSVHYRRQLRHGSPEILLRLPKALDPICTTPGCEHKSVGNGICISCRNRARKAAGLCYSCGKTADAGSYCRPCRERINANKRMNRAYVNRNKEVYNHMGVCSVEGCEGKHAAKGFCKSHYMRNARHGSPELGRKPRPACSTPGCANQHNARGLCLTCTARKRRSEGLCTQCGAPSPERAYCGPCRERTNASQRVSRAYNRAKAKRKKTMEAVTV